MLDTFIRNIRAIHPVPPALEDALRRDTEVVTLSRKDLMLREGQRADYVGMVIDGLLRVYYQKDGEDITSRFIPENHLVLAVGSFYQRKPGYEFIEALEETTLVRLHYDQLQRIYHEHPTFNFHGRVLTEHYYAVSEQRLFLLRKHSAEERYLHFLEHFGDMLQRAPLKHVATYLGMNLETLSRIRRKVAGG